MSGEKMPTLLFLYRLKTLALLHDPPDKCWHVAGELPGDHEEVARRVRHRIGVKEFEEEKFNRLVQISDILSAGADRWFSEIYSKILGSPTKILRINPLSLQETEVVKPSDEWPKKWADKLGDIFDKLGDIFERVQGSEEERYKWFYHILYGFGELLYAELYPGSVGPADTRIPHHSIFDHLCATASMVNWLCLPTSGEEIRPQGFMLVLDLAGVQEYIRTSKKMSDLGFSSLLISYLAWYLVEEVVEKIGPDVLISPTCRMNPFYYRWLLSRLEQKLKELKDELKQKLKEITFEKEGPSALALDTPAALLPSKLLLILPPLPFLAKVLSFPEKEEEIAEYFVKRYKQGWSELIEKIKQKVEYKIGEIQESRLLKEELQKAFAEMEKREVHRTPPFTLRILLVRIPEEVEREADELSKKIQEKIKDAQLKNVRLEKETLFFYEGLIKLKEKEKNFKVRGKGLLASNLSQYTQELYSKEKTYTYCTVCGELPAVLCIPRRRTAEEEGERCYEDLIPKEYRPVFDEGEHFCPYCLIKRLASTIAESEFLRIFLRKETKQRRIKSVSWYCVYPFMKVLTDERLKLEDLKQPLQDYEREIEKQDVEELIKDEAKEILRELSNERKPYIGGGEKALQELGQFSFEPLLAIGISEKILAKMEEKTGSRPPFTSYFSLIQADGDNIGKILSGRVGAILSKSDPEFFATIALKLGATVGVDRYKQIIGELLSVFPLEEGEAIKCWPSLFFTVSTGLMIGALKDHAEAKKAGPVCVDLVYSGGDDLLAVAPITEALRYVQITRSTFSMDHTQSFHELWMRGTMINKIPSMGKCTRSYSVVFSHYHAPLAPALENLRKGLNTAKDTEQIGLVKQRKDALFLEYSPRGGAGIQTVIGTRHTEQLLNLLEGLKKGVFSASLVHDLMMLVEKYDKLLCGKPEYESLVRYIAERNVPENKEKRKEVEVLISRLCESLKQKIMRTSLSQGEEERVEESLLAALVRALKIGEVMRREETV